MRSLAAAALALALVGCGEPQVAGRATVRRGEKKGVMTQFAAALDRGGHKCLLDEDGDLICDADRKDAPTVVVSYHAGAGGVHLTFVSAFPWKRPDPCADLAAAVNTWNGKASSYYAVCTPMGLTLLTMLVVPETGLSDHDAQAFLNWWGSSAAGLATGSPMGSELK